MMLIDNVTGLPWNRHKAPCAHCVPGRITTRLTKEEEWDDGKALQVLQKCTHFRSATATYPLLRRLTTTQLQRVIWVANWIGGRSAADKITAHCKRALASRTIKPQLGMRTITLKNTATGHHSKTATQLIRLVKECWEPFSWVLTIRPATPMTLAKYLENHKRMQQDTPDTELRCACHLLDTTTGHRAQQGMNGHKWILLSRAIAQSPEETAFGRLRKTWKGTKDPKDFNAKIQLVEDPDRAADHLAHQLTTLTQDALRRQGRKTDAILGSQETRRDGYETSLPQIGPC